MVKRKKKETPEMRHVCKRGKSSCGGCGYFLGFIGAAVYYIGAADGFWMGVLGFLKAMVWPAFVVFEFLKFVAA